MVITSMLGGSQYRRDFAICSSHRLGSMVTVQTLRDQRGVVTWLRSQLESGRVGLRLLSYSILIWEEVDLPGMGGKQYWGVKGKSD